MIQIKLKEFPNDFQTLSEIAGVPYPPFQKDEIFKNLSALAERDKPHKLNNRVRKFGIIQGNCSVCEVNLQKRAQSGKQRFCWHCGTRIDWRK